MVVYKGQRRRLRHIDRMIKGQYAEYFVFDKNIGNEELIPDERGKASKEFKGDRIRGRIDNSKPLKGWSRFQRARRIHKEKGIS